MSHNDDCNVNDFYFTYTFSDDRNSPEYEIYVGSDEVTYKDGHVETHHYAEITIGHRWADHLSMYFDGNSLNGSKEELLRNMTKFRDSLNEAIAKLVDL
jgi:hypothetical protein